MWFPYSFLEPKYYGKAWLRVKLEVGEILKYRTGLVHQVDRRIVENCLENKDGVLET